MENNNQMPSEHIGRLFDESSMNYLLSRTKQAMWSMVKYKELQMCYTCALKEVETKFEVLSTEFNLKHKRNPIASIHTRLKRLESIIDKMHRYRVPITLESMEANINDVAGVRIVCSYIDDIYSIADAFLKQDDITLISVKDYIKNPKDNGYRSLHLIVSIPVFFADSKKNVKVEVQIRTIAMDFWASLEHQIKYKSNMPDEEEISLQLKQCAETISSTDAQMLELRKKIEAAEDIPSEEEELFERLRKFDVPIN